MRRHRYRGPGQKAQVYLNGQSLTVSGSNQTAETGTTGFQVGTNSQGVPEPWGGLIAEIIVTDNAISDDDRERVEQYQREFFGV
ncbi:MAG: hypothetical protein IPG50_17015 [Myxococcales bacterium]|nr:hypothetical protein [Myxococcales bacterium]